MTLPPQIAAACPDLAGQAAVVLGQGHDSAAFLVGGQVVVKVPRHPAATTALAREARVLAAARPHVRLAVPNLTFHPGPPAFSRHDLLPGGQILAAEYDALGAAARDRLARDLAAFHADCHAIPLALMQTAGAGPVQPWPSAADTAPVLDRVPAALRPVAETLLRQWAGLPHDPLGDVWGHFDAHGWNMAFDPARQSLTGIYDFGDSGIGPAHRDLIYSALISPDLMARIGRHYAALTGRAVDQHRLRILSGAHRLWELAGAAPADRPFQIAALTRWAAAQT